MTIEPGAEPDPAHSRGAVVLLVDIEAAMAALIGEWLRGHGLTPLHTLPANGRLPPVALALVDLPFPRQGGTPALQALATRLPGTPVLALSPTFFTGVAADGSVARRLGVAAVLASPVARDTLLAAVDRLLGRSA